jgi:hypothetical protein
MAFPEKRPRVIVLGACHSEVLAEELASAADFVICMRGDVPDKKSIEFSLRFFQSLGYGMTIRQAFNGAAAWAGLDEGETRAVIIPDELGADDPRVYLRLIDREMSNASGRSD